MIKKERGVLTYMSQEINSLSRDNSVAGMRLMQDVEEKVAEKMQNRTQKNIDEEIER